MNTPTSARQPIEQLVAFLFSRRESILNQWRTACEADPALPQVALLSREEFNNLMSVILDALEQQLLGQAPTDDPVLAAASHGLHRWQKSHDLPALIRELHHIAAVLAQELRLFGQLYPQAEVPLLQAHIQISELMHKTVLGSISKYDDLQRLAAASRASSLQQALEQTEELSRQRGEVLRTSSHDLRSGFGIIQGAAQLISLEDISPEERLTYQEMLNRNLGNVGAMLTQLMDLARLEAGQEPVHFEEVDVGKMLTDLVAGAQPFASERGLLLRAEGPVPLVTWTDRIKLYRVAQNLLMNALKYTPSGIVSVSWSAENDWRWGFSVQDSGPGLPTGLPDVLHQQLKPTVEPVSVLAPEEGEPTPVHPNAHHDIPAGPVLGQFRSSQPGQAASGEGVGLLIVKQLCELLGATLEIESVKGRGTLFRVQQMIHPPR